MEERLDQDQLVARIADAKTKVQVGARYEHYKKLNYIVKDVALWEATNEPCVVYQAEYGARATLIRPVATWNEKVTVDGATVPRFRKLDA
jgi:hypothetical protein